MPHDCLLMAVTVALAATCSTKNIKMKSLQFWRILKGHHNFSSTFFYPNRYEIKFVHKKQNYNEYMLILNETAKCPHFLCNAKNFSWSCWTLAGTTGLKVQFVSYHLKWKLDKDMGTRGEKRNLV